MTDKDRHLPVAETFMRSSLDYNNYLSSNPEFTTCTAASIDECFQGVLPTGQADSLKPWAGSSVRQINAFCDSLDRLPRCLRSRTAMCHTSTNEFLKLVKVTREYFCLTSVRTRITQIRSDFILKTMFTWQTLHLDFVSFDFIVFRRRLS